MKDMIYRKAAIEHLKKRLIETAINNVGVIARCDSIFGDTADNRIGPWINELPSAQPEIIRCRECKYAEVADKEDSQDGYTCQFHRGSIWFSGSYCSWAERREVSE